MSKFEYVTVLSSIVIAFALSEILAGWGQLIRARHRVRVYWLHVAWMLILLLVLIQVWWGTWVYRDIEFEGFGALLLLLASPLTTVLAVFVFTPDLSERDFVDLRTHYYDNRVWFFPLAALVLLELIAVDAFVGKQPCLHVENAIRGAGIAMVLGLAASRSERVHRAALVVAFTLFVVFVGSTYRGD